MQHIIYEENPNNQYRLAILIKKSAFNKSELLKNYVSKITAIPLNEIIVLSLDYPQAKPTSKQIKECLNNLVPVLNGLKTDLLYIADSNYFKTITGLKKVTSSQGYLIDVKYPDLSNLKALLSVNYEALIYKPELITTIDLACKVTNDFFNQTYKVIGEDIIKYDKYIKDIDSIKLYLDTLYQYDQLEVDIETFSLKFYEAGIGTIGFSHAIDSGAVIQCDYVEDSEGNFSHRINNTTVKELLLEFFKSYKGKLVFHNANFDIKVLVYELFMQNDTDRENMIQGIETMCSNFDDTKLILYLATNSCSGNNLKLKHAAHPFAGDYAQDDINDIRKIPIKDLMKYNLIDCLSTRYVKNTYEPIMNQDNQREIYETLFKPSVKVILLMELIGVPIDLNAVQEAENKLKAITDEALGIILNHPKVVIALDTLTKIAYEKDYLDRKSKAVNPDKIKYKDWDDFNANNHTVFNPNSGKQTQVLLYDVIGLPVIETTKTKQPAVGADVLEDLMNHTTDNSIKELLQAYIDFFKADKIQTTFITAFKEHSVLKADGNHYLHGSFNIGGTISGRLSSNSPNLQTLPSGSKFAKLIKGCIKAPEGFLFGGADFLSLEARINALVTKDPAKLAVYTDGYESHSYSAYGYWPTRFPYVRKASQEKRVYKVISEDGTVTYLKETDLVVTPDGTTLPLKDTTYI